MLSTEPRMESVGDMSADAPFAAASMMPAAQYQE